MGVSYHLYPFCSVVLRRSLILLCIVYILVLIFNFLKLKNAWFRLLLRKLLNTNFEFKLNKRKSGNKFNLCQCCIHGYNFFYNSYKNECRNGRLMHLDNVLEWVPRKTEVSIKKSIWYVEGRLHVLWLCLLSVTMDNRLSFWICQIRRGGIKGWADHYLYRLCVIDDMVGFLI